MTTTDNSLQIAKIERDIKAAQKHVDLGKALERLKHNADFRKVVIERYLQDEAIRLVHLKADVNMQGAQQQAGITRDIDAVGAFKLFLDTVAFMSRDGEKTIADGQEQIDEMEQEAADENGGAQ